MSQPAASAATIEVLWRPGCPYCARLRRGLRRAGVPTLERDIWADPAAAAQVRAVTGGGETVPTVLVGGRALVNPSVADVLAAAGQKRLDDGAGAVASVPETAAAGARAAAGSTLVVTALWILLAVWRPATTWHLGPVLAAAAAPWLIGQDVRTGNRRAVPRLAVASGAGLLLAATATGALEAVGPRSNPTVLGFPTPWTEALALAGAGAALAALPGLLRALRRPAEVPVMGAGDEAGEGTS
jgi:glutaredoxin